MGVYRLHNTIQTYDWGDTKWIPDLLGIDNTENKPMAEVWMGAHPSAPSRVVVSDGEYPLTELIEKDPKGILGKRVMKRFGGSLPFLFKVLAAGKPLSIQAHPDKRQAEEGFARENEAGIPLTAFERNYKDDNHKPEVICAVTDFHAMRGFRPLEEIQREFSRLFSGYSHPFRIPEKEDGLRPFLHSLLSASKEEIEGAIGRAISEITKRDRGGRLDYSWVKRLNETYPGDVGVLCPLFLNILVLKPGEGMYLPAGELHSYLHGLGIELMANSDNVLRGGCTSKHIAKDELMKVLRFASGKPAVLRPGSDKRGEAVYPADAEEFRLSVITLNGQREYYEPDTEQAVILLCTEGSGRVRPQRGSSLQLGRGNSILITADTGHYSIEGKGSFYKASAGMRTE